jgi:hypothetical protein
MWTMIFVEKNKTLPFVGSEKIGKYDVWAAAPPCVLAILSPCTHFSLASSSGLRTIAFTVLARCIVTSYRHRKCFLTDRYMILSTQIKEQK